jgi:hypothetical protein
MLHAPTRPLTDGEEAFWPTVREVVSWEGLGLVLRAGGEVTDRSVRIVLSTELVDSTPFLSGGEVLLTTGLAWTSAGDPAEFVHAGVRAGVAAIGFGTGPWSETVPEPLLAAARRAAVPVLEVPRSTPFMAVAEQVAAEQARRRAHHAERLTLGALMDHVRRGQADPAVLEDHAPFLYAGNISLAVACHADDDGAAAPAGGRLLVGHRDRRAIVVGEEAAVRWYVESRGIEVYGWGAPATAHGLRRLLGEAWSAYEVARQRGRPASAKDLASVGGLLARLTPEQLAPFADHVIGPIRRYDAIHGTDLLTTVVSFVRGRGRGSLTETGQDLYLHVNTVRKRMSRVGSLLGIDPLDPEGYLVLHLAVHSDQEARPREPRSAGAPSRRG